MNDRVKELIKLAQNGDETAKSIIIKENSGLIWSIVRRFRDRGCDAEDLFQIGSIGLLKCIDKFDLDYNVEFSTYAVPMIMGEIKRFLRDDGMIKVSRPLKELAVKARYMQEAMFKRDGAMPAASVLAKAVGADVETLAEALESTRDIESINRTVYQSDGSGIFLIDKITGGENCEEKLVDIISVREIIEKLPETERKILKLRYFDDKTQSEIASAIGISQVQVSRIEKRAKETLKKTLMPEKFKKK